MNGFTSKISTVLPGLSGDANTKRSVKSRRESSPGNLSMAALKWLDIVAPFSSAVRSPGRPNKPKIRPRVSAIYCTMVLVDTLVSGVHDEVAINPNPVLEAYRE